MTTNRCAAVVTTKSKGKARAEPLPSSAPSLPLPAPPCAANKDSQTGPIRSKGKKGTRKYITIDAFTPVVLDMEADPRGMTGICQWLVDDNHICGEHYNMNFVCDHVRISHLKPTVPESEWDPESPTFRFKCRWHRCKHAGKELKLCSLKNHFLKHRPPKLCQWCLRVFDRQHLLKDHTKECERNPKNVASGSK
ncbi:hypothetical protein VNI00_014782 [Paramarasmius palmivorus]|uniref:C2H2-type domain-containing protein n=1 Tax=Paramarasmius palmivorus TaxID=297713 RepID=A0AAW0BQG1_9AGAR